MNKNELVAEVAKRTAKPKYETENMVTTTLDVIADTLAEGEPVKLIGFGQFDVKERAARLGRNPKTKEEVHIPATRKPVFKPGKGLCDAVAGE